MQPSAPLSPPFHPHSLLSDCRSVQVGCTRFSRCCYLIIDLCSPLSKETGPGLGRSHLISAVELGCLNTISLLFFAPLSFFLPFPVFPREISSQDRLGDDRQLRRPLACSVLWSSLHFRPPCASLCGYCVVVRTPLHLPTTDGAVPPTFSPPQPPLVSYHFFLRAPQASAPISAHHCLVQMAPESLLSQLTENTAR